MPVPLCCPSQNGCVALKPHEHQKYFLPASTVTLVGNLSLILKLILSIFVKLIINSYITKKIKLYMEKIDIYTDGACSGNPGPGGWAALLRYNGVEKEISGFEFKTTNNRMELMAAIKALETITKPLAITIHTDSKYVMDGITKWINTWKKKGWRTSTGGEVKNLDLWQELDVLSQRYTINWIWVKGHSGHPENDRADLLARNAIVSAMMIRECS